MYWASFEMLVHGEFQAHNVACKVVCLSNAIGFQVRGRYLCSHDLLMAIKPNPTKPEPRFRVAKQLKNAANMVRVDVGDNEEVDDTIRSD